MNQLVMLRLADDFMIRNFLAFICVAFIALLCAGVVVMVTILIVKLLMNKISK